jgi:hypothetical protein
MKSLIANISILTLSFSSYAQIGAKAQQNGLTGIWQNNDFGYQMTLILQANNTGEFDGESIQYKVIGSTLNVTQSGLTNQYNYTLSGNSLTLSGGDIEQPITFTRAGATKATNTSTVGAIASKNATDNIIGQWSGYGETIEFKTSGECTYLGQTYPYQLSQGHVTLQTAQGGVMMAYTISGNQLSLTANGKTLQYTRGKAASNAGTGLKSTGAGRVAMELVGKWCYVNVTSSYSGGSSSEQCITLHENGTYEYYGESSRSVDGGTFYGGTSSQNGDRGTWSYDGVRIYYQSQTGQGSGSYLLEKRNHPKNNDPMIVLDGAAYATFYQKSPW